ncbi:MAG: hypothetical protein QM730_03300 [Anaerolineales bacterium]
MTDQPTPTKKTPWLFIILGAIAALCLCVVVIGVAYFMFFVPVSSSTTIITQEPVEVVTVEVATPLPTEVPAQGSDNPLTTEAAAVGSAVDIGNKMTLTILGVTRPADEIVANGNSFNTTAPEGEEYIQVQVQVDCANDVGTPCRFFPTVMKIHLSDGSTRDLQTFLEGVDDWDTSIDIDGGTTQKGVLLFIVPKSETELVISYQDVYADQPVLLQLP